MNKKVNIVTLSKMISLLLLLSITGCYETTHDIKATDDLSGKKVLAGRFLFYENDAPLKDSSLKFVMFYQKQGDKEVQALEPDADGYIYIPVTAGRYYFAGVRVMVKINEVLNFSFSTIPTLFVNDSDSAVNFGTINVKFSQSAGEKIAAHLVGLSRAHISIEHVPDYDVTRLEIVEKIGASMSLRERKVMFIKRVKKTEKPTPKE
jgi:hypothetical protein